MFSDKLTTKIAELDFNNRALLFAELSRVAYFTEYHATRLAKRLGFTTVEYYNIDGAEAYRFMNKRDMVFACRGTQPKQFNDIKNKYGHCSSFAVWAEVGDTPKSNTGDLSVLDPDINKELLSILNVDVVLLGLNGSRVVDPESTAPPLSIFHSWTSFQQDYKIRYAFKDSPYWGAYMTDIIKHYGEVDSTKTMEYLKRNKESQ